MRKSSTFLIALFFYSQGIGDIFIPKSSSAFIPIAFVQKTDIRAAANLACIGFNLFDGKSRNEVEK